MSAPTALSGDAVQAAINVSIAQSRRLVSSWLPPPTPEEVASQKTEEQMAKEDAELFRPMPPRLGLGAPIPKDFLDNTDPKARRQAISTNEHLKRKIMGRTRPSGSQEASKPRPRFGNDQSDSNDDDDEEGRSSLGKPKRRKVVLEKKEDGKNNIANKEESDFCTKGVDEKGIKLYTPPPPPPPTYTREETIKASPKRPVRFGAYLDVHKIERVKKKKKKKLTNQDIT